MELKTRINEYGYEIVDCPFCNSQFYVHRNAIDPLKSLKTHITNQAKNEAFWSEFSEEEVPAMHLAYYKSHTTDKRVIVQEKKRLYDTDLRLLD